MNKVAVVTGGSSGIGLHLCRLFAQSGYDVFELSRSGKSDNGIEHVDTDLMQENSVQSAFDFIAQKTQHIDILVNNAGMGISGAVEYTALSDAKRLFDINLFGAVCATAQALPLLRAAKGRIVNISSAAAVLPVPFQAFYSASKSAVNGYSLALANEIKRFGIGVAVVMPGDAKTGFTKARQKTNLGNATYGGAIERSVSLMERDEQNGMTSDYVAQKIYEVATKKRCKVLSTIGMKYKLFAILSKCLPTDLVNRLIGSIYAK